MSSKSLDKFYTSPKVAEAFITKVDEICGLSSFDQIIEPSAGNGSFLKFLPQNTIALDIKPESTRIKEQDFFEYESDYHSLFNNINVLTIGNPPFGKGYMNPLAKGFFNHAAKFSNVIAFIVPQKWHTAWKVHFQLDNSFGLYYSSVLDKDSFLLDDNPYNVNCCAQIWSKIPIKGMENLRIRKRPPTKHEDFEMFLTCDNVPSLPKVREQLQKKEYWDFALKYWGKISVCEMSEVPVETTTHYLFKSKKPYVKDILNRIDWSKYVSNMGAPNVGGKSTLVKAYEETKKTLGYDA